MSGENSLSPILLTTMPKAGTYLLAEVLSEIGAKNRHLHVAEHHAENLLLCGDEVNKLRPSEAKVPLKLSQALYTVQSGEFVFGHIAKPLLNQDALNRFKIIYSYRDPKEAMQAEFYWFREIRQDMPYKFARYNELSPEKHFVKYLEMLGFKKIGLFRFLDMWKGDNLALKLDFNKFRSDQSYACERIVAMGKHIGIPVSEERAREILDTCFNKDTKTKTKRDRTINLWTDEAEAAYAKLQRKQKLYDLVRPTYRFLRDRLLCRKAN